MIMFTNYQVYENQRGHIIEIDLQHIKGEDPMLTENIIAYPGEMLKIGAEVAQAIYVELFPDAEG